MDRSKIKSIGVSVIRQDGPYRLELDYIKACNTPQTFGDFDVLEPGQYLDKDGQIVQVEQGQEPPEGASIEWFPSTKNK